MSDKEKLFEEQQAPLKNTDHAFVQVGHNGEPVIPEEEHKDREHETGERPSDREER